MKFVITMIISAIVMFLIDFNKESFPNHSMGIFYFIFIVIIGYCVFKLIDNKKNKK
ncbi:hypothetical protein LGMK_09155 [Leuconostoc sp. C2]|uniref:Uncharacterized protein n=1 Tax=Leuconostoc kimchii (strain IMSNU 11154 / KCTC 2386 / IH25) TaxID=762051 RepID=D5T1N0_LEUKI|nr:hypothetical protein LKI_03185 [Leuconostoc kimchii IMSNU 11154]AEJ31880.1 hypothetical protein LGMK_09155 [Leuconostoc sp. C2]